MYSIGIGPSSSHTVGPMRAARLFVEGLQRDGLLGGVARLRVQLFGSLGATGHGHGSEAAVLLGLMGEDPATVDVDGAPARVEQVRAQGRLGVAGGHEVPFGPDDLVMHRRKALPAHPNGMVFTAFGNPDGEPDGEQVVLTERTYYSVGGGFVVDEGAVGAERVVEDATAVPHPFRTGAELLAACEAVGGSVSDVMLANERAWRSEADVREGLLRIWAVMQECVVTGCSTDGVLPGGLKVRRRAPALHRSLSSGAGAADPLHVMDWVNLYALAVNEQNAAGGRVVTAPTNGAAGVVPAVLHYYVRFVAGPAGRSAEQVDDAVVRFLLTAAAIGILIKHGASISGAEMGCQGEVGSASAMAAAALCEVLGGTPQQVENAAEIGVEHHLGLTCDPVGGLVQIPCIERNAIASVKAVNAARLALGGDGVHTVSLDKAIKTMRDTGRDMHVKYKETSRGGLAVNVVEC
ncbi:L-serine ammonia-lyase [Quadrisphaera sp. RL12-1S]|nr:L-serine ammonia-lyase [Quadrisphaera sp. RL12-1S]MBC3760640.1 L-serine ammonia-lyase [Quadrisphaera sp. RL12-1S]